MSALLGRVAAGGHGAQGDPGTAAVSARGTETACAHETPAGHETARSAETTPELRLLAPVSDAPSGVVIAGVAAALKALSEAGAVQTVTAADGRLYLRVGDGWFAWDAACEVAAGAFASSMVELEGARVRQLGWRRRLLGRRAALDGTETAG